MKRRLAAVLLATIVAAVGLSLAPAASARGVYVVDKSPHRGKCKVGHHHRRPFTTIQAAVDAAGPWDTIVVCPGLYNETVEVPETDHHLTILGAKAGQDARKRDRKHESIVTGDPATGAKTGAVQLYADHVTWDGFTILGPDINANPGIPRPGPGLYTSPGSSGYRILNTIFEENGIGLHLGASGQRTTKIQRNLFIKNNEFEGAGAGSGVYSDDGAVDVVITDNKFKGHNQSAILFADHAADDPVPQKDILVANNKSIDDKAFATFYASVRVCITDNYVRAGVGATPDAASAIYIGPRNAHVVVQANRILSATGSGIAVTPGLASPDASPRNVRILKNKVSDNGEHGIELVGGLPGQYEVRGNRAVDNKLVGLHVAATTAGARLHRNTALGNGRWDCQDESTGGTGPEGIRNTWADNTGGTADPRVICDPPRDDGRQHHDKPKQRHTKHEKQHHKKQHKRKGKDKDKKKRHGNKGSWSPCLPCKF